MWDKLMNREPAAFISAVAAVMLAVIALFPLREGVTAALDAVVIAGGGVLVAFAVNKDGQLAAILGFVRAGLALGLILGLALTETQQTLILAAAEALVGLFLRTQVEAKMTPDGVWRPTMVA